MKNNTAIIVIIALLSGGGLGFFGGIQYQKGQRPQLTGQFSPRGISGANGARFRNGNGAVGEIISLDTNAITVKLQDGSSKIVLLTSAASINKATSTTVSDLAVGQRVAAFGATNSDGSITATNVQINPVIRVPEGVSGATGASQ